MTTRKILALSFEHFNTLHLWECSFQAFRVHGEVEEGAVIYDKATGKSRGYGFITYKNIESTQIALKAPSKLIDVSICHV